MLDLRQTRVFLKPRQNANRWFNLGDQDRRMIINDTSSHTSYLPGHFAGCSAVIAHKAKEQEAALELAYRAMERAGDHLLSQ